MIKNFVKILELLGDRLEVCVSVFLARQISPRQHSAVMAFIPNRNSVRIRVWSSLSVSESVCVCQTWSGNSGPFSIDHVHLRPLTMSSLKNTCFQNMCAESTLGELAISLVLVILCDPVNIETRGDKLQDKSGFPD